MSSLIIPGCGHIRPNPSSIPQAAPLILSLNTEPCFACELHRAAEVAIFGYHTNVGGPHEILTGCIGGASGVTLRNMRMS